MTGLTPENVAVLRRFAEALAGTDDPNVVDFRTFAWRFNVALPPGSTTPFGQAADVITDAHRCRAKGEITASEASSIIERMLT